MVWPNAHVQKTWFGQWSMRRSHGLANGAWAESMVWPLVHAQKARFDRWRMRRKPWFGHWRMRGKAWFMHKKHFAFCLQLCNYCRIEPKHDFVTWQADPNSFSIPLDTNCIKLNVFSTLKTLFCSNYNDFWVQSVADCFPLYSTMYNCTLYSTC